MGGWMQRGGRQQRQGCSGGGGKCMGGVPNSASGNKRKRKRHSEVRCICSLHRAGGRRAWMWRCASRCTGAAAGSGSSGWRRLPPHACGAWRPPRQLPRAGAANCQGAMHMGAACAEKARRAERPGGGEVVVMCSVRGGSTGAARQRPLYLTCGVLRGSPGGYHRSLSSEAAGHGICMRVGGGGGGRPRWWGSHAPPCPV